VFESIVKLRQASNRREVVWRPAHDLLELDARLVVLPEVQQRPPERDARGNVVGELLEAVAAQTDRLLQRAGPTEPLGDRAKRGRVFRRHFRPAVQHQT
jgi:hypothetical protein